MPNFAFPLFDEA